MVDYANTFGQLGAELKVMRKTEALYEHSHFATVATYSKRLLTAAYSTSVDEEEIAATNGKYALENETTPAVQDIHTAQLSTFETGFFPVLDVELSTTPKDKSAGAISYVYDSSLTNGQIAIKDREGRWGALRRSMLADAQTIQANTLTFGNFVPASTNTGLISTAASVVTGLDHTLSGSITFEVTDDTVGATKLSVTNYLTKKLPDGTESVEADNELTIGKSFEDGPTGLTCSLVLYAAPTETGDTGNLVSGTSITNPTEGDSNKGKVYIYVERQAAAPIWLIQWYSDSALTTLVAQTTTDTAVGTYAASMTGASGMIVAFTFHRVNADTLLPVAGNSTSMSIDIRSPRIGDRWTKTVANNEAGNFATKLAHRYRISLPSGGAPTISDALATSVSIS